MAELNFDALKLSIAALEQGLEEHAQYPQLLTVRDGVIQRFEVAVDISQKLIRRVLQEVIRWSLRASPKMPCGKRLAWRSLPMRNAGSGMSMPETKPRISTITTKPMPFLSAYPGSCPIPPGRRRPHPCGCAHGRRNGVADTRTDRPIVRA